MSLKSSAAYRLSAASISAMRACGRSGYDPTRSLHPGNAMKYQDEIIGLLIGLLIVIAFVVFIVGLLSMMA